MNNPVSETLRRLAAVKKQLPRKAAALVVDFFKGRFKRQSWVDAGVEKWPARKGDKKKGRGRAILVKSGRLRRSIRAVSVTADRVVIGTDVPYAKIHNEGEKIEGTQNVSAHTRRAHRRKGYIRGGKKIKSGKVQEHTVRSYTRKVNTVMPRRRFMGASAALEKRLGGMLAREIGGVLK